MLIPYLTAGLIMGVILLVSWLVSIGALLSPTRSTTGFVVLNWAIVIDSIAILVVGTSLWFYTLHIQDNYLAVWEVQSNATKIAVQDLVSGQATPMRRHADDSDPVVYPSSNAAATSSPTTRPLL